MKRIKLKWNTRCKLCLLPSILGTMVFFALPYVRMLYYSLIENQFSRKFVGLQHYVNTIQNQYFRLALGNSLLIIMICIPVLMGLALAISLASSYGIRRLRAVFVGHKAISQSVIAVVLPMLIPTASIVLIWQTVFTDAATPLPIYLLFIWKNIGICVILLSAAFTAIPPVVFEAARLDGAGPVQLHLRITIPMIMPTVVFSVLLSVVNSFKIFKESYLFYGTSYPPNHSYTLQYYMNNHFLKLNYQSLAASAVLTSILVFGIVAVGLHLQRRYER